MLLKLTTSQMPIHVFKSEYKLIRRGILLFLFIFFLSNLATAQITPNRFNSETNLRFKKISVEEGLSQSTVFSILKDSQGFMWFGTRGGGLNKYDGYNFTVYKNDPNDSTSLSNNEVISLFEDSKGQLWVGTRKGGLNLFDPMSESFSQFKKSNKTGSISGNTVNVIFEDSKNNLWIGTSLGLDLFHEGEFISNVIPEIDKRHITSMDEDEEGKLYISDKTGLFIYNTLNGQSTYIENTDISPEASTSNYSIPVLVDSKKNKWIGSSYGVKLLLSNTSFTSFENKYNLGWGPNTEVRQIFEDSEGNLWIGTITGLYRYNPNTNTLQLFQKNENDPLSLSHNSIYSIYEDNNGIIWIGTWGGGVNMLTNKLLKFEHYQHQSFNPSSLSNNVVSSFAEDKNGIWIGTESGGLNFLKNGSNQFEHYENIKDDPTSLSNNHIKTLCFDVDGRLWIGTFGSGLNMLDKKTNSFIHYLPKCKIFTLSEGLDGNLWIGTLHGLYRFNYKRNELNHYTNQPDDNTSLSHNFVNVLYMDSENTMWIGTKEAGLMRYNSTSDNFIRYTNLPKDSLSLPSNYIISINENTIGDLLIGTNNGLCQYDKENDLFIPIQIKSIPDKNINGILCDNESNCWISTNGGITKVTQKGSVINYDINDGLQSKEFNRSSYFKSKSGKFYFGGINGFNSFYPDIIPINNDIPPIVITDFRISNHRVHPNEKNSPLYKPISETENLILDYDQSDFSFEFVVLNYIAPEKNQYMYMLEGYNNSWIFAGKNRVATYTNIKPGHYTFRVKGSNNDNVWNETDSAITIRIKPPLWKTPFAFVSYILLLIIFLILFRKIITYRIEQQNIIQSQRLEKKRINEMNQMKLRFFTNVAHEFRTPLTLISGPLSKISSYQNDNDEHKYLLGIVQNNVKRLLILVNELMDFRKAEQEKLKLRITNNNLPDFLEDLVECFSESATEKNISLQFINSIDIKKEYWFDKGIIDKVVFNLLSNAIKYTPRGGCIDVILSIDGNNVSISVKDDGKGIKKENIEKIFDRYYQEEDEYVKNFGTGIGLAFSKRLIEAHHGNIDAESSPNSGSVFRITFPITIDAYPNDTLKQKSNKNELKIEHDLFQLSENQLPINPIELKGKQNHKLLIVEDNDELRNYLINHFKTFKVYFAANGKEGLNIAQKEIPDIIISDIMMPEMDGLEFCNQLKTHFSTSHIPIILLTAMAEVSQKILGIETGADAYIEKPFDMNLLEVTVNNLLLQQKRLRKHFLEEPELNIDDLPINKHEKKFINTVNSLIENNLSNSNFSVENLALNLGMSRSQLFRKFRACFELSPSEIIRNERLKHSKELIHLGEHNINEISDLVGFKSSSYYITSFKKHFGITPNDYLKSLHNKSNLQ